MEVDDWRGDLDRRMAEMLAEVRRQREVNRGMARELVKMRHVLAEIGHPVELAGWGYRAVKNADPDNWHEVTEEVAELPPHLWSDGWHMERRMLYGGQWQRMPRKDTETASQGGGGVGGSGTSSVDGEKARMDIQGFGSPCNVCGRGSMYRDENGGYFCAWHFRPESLTQD